MDFSPPSLHETQTHDQALVVAETAKFLAPLSRDSREAYLSKVQGYAENCGLKKCRKPPVQLRMRDERDKVGGVGVLIF